MANKDAMLEALEEIENGMCRIKERRSIWQNSLVYALCQAVRAASDGQDQGGTEMRIDGKTLPNNPMKAYQQGKLIGTKQNMDLVSEVLLTKFGFHVLEETPDSHDTMSIEYLQKCLVKLVNAKNSGYVTKKDIADALRSDYKLINNAE